MRDLIAETREVADQGRHYLPPLVRTLMLDLCDHASRLETLLERLEIAADTYIIAPSTAELENFLAEADRVFIDWRRPAIISQPAAA